MYVISVSEWFPMEDGEHHIRYCVCQEFEIAEHVWDNGVVDATATHLKPGSMKYTCTVCGGTKYEEIPCTTEHEWSEWRAIDGDTLHKRICDCGTSETARHTLKWGIGEDPAVYIGICECGYTESERFIPEENESDTVAITVTVDEKATGASTIMNSELLSAISELVNSKDM